MTIGIKSVLTNAFHGTEYKSRYTREHLITIADRIAAGQESAPSERALIRRIKAALCGVKGCRCATTELSERAG